MRYPNVRRECKLIEVIESHQLVGSGVENDPYRENIVYFTKDGLFLAEYDGHIQILLEKMLNADKT